MGDVRIKILQQGDEAALESFLIPRQETSMFLLGNLRSAGFVDKGKRFEGTYAAALDDEKILAVVAHYWNNNLLLQAPAHLEILLPAVISASGRPVAGLLGPDAQVRNAKKLLGLAPEDLQHDEAERLYSLNLDRLNMPEILNRERAFVRQASEEDLDLLTEWRMGLRVETLGEQDSDKVRRQTRAGTTSAVKAGRIWILEVDGEPVSTTGFNAAVADSAGTSIVQIGGVYTPPGKRSRGYGRAVVAGSLAAARAQGVKKAILFTGESNIPAHKAYQALGFRRIDTYRLTFLRQIS